MADRKYATFARDEDDGKALLDWWGGLDKRRGDRAELRRARSGADVLLVPAFHRLHRAVAGTGVPADAVRLAAVAGVVSHVREDEPGIRFARRLAMPAKKGSEAAMSGLRFRRLLAVQEPDELYPALLRALRLAGLKADIADLARSAYLWTHPKWIDGIRHEWAFAYYAQAPSEK